MLVSLLLRRASPIKVESSFSGPGLEGKCGPDLEAMCGPDLEAMTREWGSPCLLGTSITCSVDW